MGVGMVMLIVLVVTIVVMLLVALVPMHLAKRSDLTDSQRGELLELRKLKRAVNQLAVSHQEIEPNLAACILDEVHKYEMKELS